MPIWRKEHETSRVMVHLFGIVIFAIAATALCGQISGRPVLYSWGFTGTMSLPTAFCLCLAGIGFFLVSRGEALHAGGS